MGIEMGTAGSDGVKRFFFVLERLVFFSSLKIAMCILRSKSHLRVLPQLTFFVATSTRTYTRLHWYVYYYDLYF